MELLDEDMLAAGEFEAAPALLPPHDAMSQWLPHDAGGIFPGSFERRSFRFGHCLSKHPLFQLPQLLNLALRRPDDLDHAYWSNGDVAPQDRWEKGMDATSSLAETIAGIAHNKSLVMLRHLEDDPAYGPLIGALFARFVELCGPRLRSDAALGRATIIIASPQRVTPYHIDSDSNFLLQLAGNKRLSVLDHRDRGVIADEELESFFAGDFNGARYAERYRARATHYGIRPGDGLHIPWTAPHWALNGDKVSIALSLAYDLRSGYRRAKIHQLNRRLRRWGLRPVSPGASRLGDLVKLAAKNTWNGLRMIRGKRTDPSTERGWRPRASQKPADFNPRPGRWW